MPPLSLVAVHPRHAFAPRLHRRSKVCFVSSLLNTFRGSSFLFCPLSLSIFTSSFSRSLTRYHFSLLLLLCLWSFSLGLRPTRVDHLASVITFLSAATHVSRLPCCSVTLLCSRLAPLANPKHLLTMSHPRFPLALFSICSPLFIFLLSPAYTQIYPLTPPPLLEM